MESTLPEIKLYILDVEGTVSPLSFVRETLFPYAARQARHYILQSFSTRDTQLLMFALEAHHRLDQKQGRNPPPLDLSSTSSIAQSMGDYIAWLIERDDKLAALKELQGRIWQEGYTQGHLRAPVFPDAAPALARWKARGADVAIFSSGSTLAQIMFFTHTTAGDLSSFVTLFCDAAASGPKTDPESYARIARPFEVAPENVLFVSDTVAELAAARQAGMQSAYIIRVGNQVQPINDYSIPSILTFEEIP